MKTALVIGSTGGIGSAIVDYLQDDYKLICPTKQELNLEGDNQAAITEYLNNTNPDIIINAAGTFGNNDVMYDKIFDVNLRANWSMLWYYLNNKPQKAVKLIMIGSSAYVGGRKDYALYAASKAALHSMFESASELFAGSNLVIGLVHPRKVDTKMLDIVENIDRSNCLSPKSLAKKIIEFVGKLELSTYVAINN